MSEHYAAAGNRSSAGSSDTAPPKVASEIALSVLAYNPTRVMNIVGVKPVMAAITA